MNQFLNWENVIVELIIENPKKKFRNKNRGKVSEWVKNCFANSGNTSLSVAQD